MTLPIETRFKKGQSGNPKGRPKGPLMDRVLKEKLAENDGYLAEALAVRLIQLARNGSLKALELVLERTEGKAVASIDMRMSNEAESVSDIDDKIRQLLNRAGSREAEPRGKAGTTEPAPDPGKDPRVQ
jgi:hypothetical protein